MSARLAYLLLVMAAFLVGAFLSVLDPVTVNWAWLLPVLGAGAVGLAGYRRERHRVARAGHRLSGDMQTLADALTAINRELQAMNQGPATLPVYEARFEIDRRLRDHLEAFVEARETMIHVFGMKRYADVMSAFAAGERYINRVWSASTDGYEDEVRGYLGRASDQFKEAEHLFTELRAETGQGAALPESA